MLLNEHCARRLSHHVKVVGRLRQAAPIAAAATATAAAGGGGGTRRSGVVDLREDRVRMEERRNNKMGRASEFLCEKMNQKANIFSENIPP